jgi:uncharacterized protein with GYD domain
MPIYISLNKLTDKGIRTFKESPSRLDAFKKSLEDAGGKFIGFYLTMGRYDAVLIVESPSDEVAAALALSVGGQGNVRTETLKAFTEDEYREIITKIP